MAAQKTDRHPIAGFLVAASATSCACVLTNPMEVVKTRFQLQGELAKSSPNRIYKHVFDAFYKIARDEGLRGIQAGLLPGILYQSTMNGTRLGMFAPLQRFLKADANTDGQVSFFFKNLAAGAISGACGAAVGSPFFLVKARLQGQSNVHKIRSAGAEVFHYRDMTDAFRSIIADEGWRGLARGMDAAVPRVMAGSAAQLSSYSSCKRLVQSTGFFHSELYTYIASSLVAGLVVTTVMNPFDVVSTRLYSQSAKHLVYTGPIDCFMKTFRAEGLRGFYKGWAAHYFRLGPHTIFTFSE
eukprot:TRINITY_DN1097_c0_g1_i4.p1 TRINITY_DN1097_c0_g1~~TRINITY_DN1097_c0_g1_i4.p1  ORF type:complete len:298 (+),score=80.43 TRINITY_DN1097_c0_g1_i4:183-1076(+)